MVGLEDDSTEGLGEALVVDSDRAGQESAPITLPTSTTPFESLFQTGFLGDDVMPLLALEISSTTELLGGSEEGTAEDTTFEAEQFSNGVTSGANMTREDNEDEEEAGE